MWVTLWPPWVGLPMAFPLGSDGHALIHNEGDQLQDSGGDGGTGLSATTREVSGEPGRVGPPISHFRAASV